MSGNLVERTRQERALHEAAHAVQAMVNGLGVVWADVGSNPPVVRTRRKAEMEKAGYKLGKLNPAPLTEELIDFYKKDIEQRVAGPLATFREDCERRGRSIPAVAPTAPRLEECGGAWDMAVALRAATILAQSLSNCEPQRYVDHAMHKVWRESILNAERWDAILLLGRALNQRGSLNGREVGDIVGALDA